MATMGNISVNMDNWLKQTRIRFCKEIICKFNCYPITLECNLKTIEIDKGRLCKQFEARPND